MKLKKIAIGLLSASLIMQYVPEARAAESVVCNTFEQYATNYVPTELGISTESVAYIADKNENSDKALRFALKGDSNGASFSNPALTSDRRTFSSGLMIPTGVTATIAALDSGNNAVTVMTVADDGTIKNANGKRVSGQIKGDKLYHISFITDSFDKRYSICIEGSTVSENQYLASLPDEVFGFSVTFADSGSEKKYAYIDNVYIADGYHEMPDIKKTAYNEEVLPPVAESESSVSEVGDSVLLNCDFDTDDSMLGVRFNAGRQIFERRYDEARGNGYLAAEVAGEAEGNVDFTIDAGDKTKLVIEADFKFDKLGTSGMIFFSRGEGYNYLLRYNTSGQVQTYQRANVCTLKKNEWTTISLVCDFDKMVYDIYVNGTATNKNVAMGYSVKESLQTLRAITINGGTLGANLLLDNLKVYEGAEIRSIPKADAVKEPKSIMPDGSEAKEVLGSNSAFSILGESAYVNGEKVNLKGKIYLKTGSTMVPARLLAESSGYSYEWDEASGRATINGSIILSASSSSVIKDGEALDIGLTPDVKDGDIYIPLRFAAEKLFGKSLYWDNRGFAVITDEPVSFTTEQIWAISNYLLYERPDVQTILDAFNANGVNVHPRIVINNDDIARIKYNYENSPRVRKWIDDLIVNADKILGYPVSEYTKDSDGRILEQARSILERVQTMGIAYFMTGDIKYPQRAWKELEAAGNFPDWNPKVHYLDTGEMIAAFAIGYDWMYDYWTDNQKAFLVDRIKTYGLDWSYKCYYGTYVGNSGWWPRVHNNWNAATNCGTAIGAIALMDIYPEYCADLVSHALRGLEALNQGFYPSGAWEEGTAYWGYLSQYLSMFDRTMHISFDTDFNITKAPGLSKSVEFIVAMHGPEGSNNFHDAGQGYSVGYPTLWYADEFGLPAAVGERLMNIEFYGGSPTLYDILYYQGDSETIDSGYTLDTYFESTEYVAMRSKYADPEATFLSYHAGNVGGAHSHYDVGAFVLDMSGVRWAIDLGADSYGISGYFGTNRPKIYRIRAEGHNVLVIDPDERAGQDVNAFAQVIKNESGLSSAYSVVDLSAAYADYADSAIRGFMLGDSRRTATVRDELKLKDGEHEIYWFMHTKADVEIIDDKTAILSAEGKQLKVQLVTDIADAKFSVMPASPFPSTPEVAGQATNSDTRKLTVSGHASGEVYIEVRMSDAEDFYSANAPLNLSISEWTVDNSIPQVRPYIDSISIDGKVIDGFEPRLTYYTHKIAFSRKAMPEVAATAPEGCGVEIIPAANETEMTKVKVYNLANPLDSRTYTIAYTEAITEADSLYSVINIRASSVPQEINHEKNVNDGDLSTRWSADGDGEWISLEFEEEVPIELISVAVMSGTSRTTSFDIQVSDDGNTWTDVISYTTSGKTNDLEYIKADASGKFIRLVGHGNSANTWNSITEFGVVDTRGWN